MSTTHRSKWRSALLAGCLAMPAGEHFARAAEGDWLDIDPKSARALQPAPLWGTWEGASGPDDRWTLVDPWGAEAADRNQKGAPQGLAGAPSEEDPVPLPGAGLYDPERKLSLDRGLALSDPRSTPQDSPPDEVPHWDGDGLVDPWD